MAGFVILLVAVIANLFLQIPALSLAISALFILFSTGAILWETSNIIHGGETNYSHCWPVRFSVQPVYQLVEHSRFRS